MLSALTGSTFATFAAFNAIFAVQVEDLPKTLYRKGRKGIRKDRKESPARFNFRPELRLLPCFRPAAV